MKTTYQSNLFTFAIIAQLLLSSMAYSQFSIDFSELSDKEVFQLAFRKDAKEELRRRETLLSTKEEKKAFWVNGRQLQGQKDFPQQFSDDELIEYVGFHSNVTIMVDARQELIARYTGASLEEVEESKQLIQHRLLNMDYNSHQQPNVYWTHNAYNGLVLTLLPALNEQQALDFVTKVYLEREEIEGGGLEPFLRIIRHHFEPPYSDPMRGELTLNKLQELLPGEELQRAMGILHQSGESGFNLLKDLDWSSTDYGIRCMSHVGTSASQQLLMDHYTNTPAENIDKRHHILHYMAIAQRSKSKPIADASVQHFIRESLHEYINPETMPKIVSKLKKAIHIVLSTHDPYWLPELYQLRMHLETETFPEDIGLHSEPERIPNKFRHLNIKLDDTIEKLEQIKAKQEEEQ